MQNIATAHIFLSNVTGVIWNNRNYKKDISAFVKILRYIFCLKILSWSNITGKNKMQNKKLELTQEELNLLQTILCFMKDKEDWIYSERTGLLTAKVLLNPDENVSRIVNSIFEKTYTANFVTHGNTQTG